MKGNPCTCAGTEPGCPQHESFCGQPEPETHCAPDCIWQTPHDHACMTEDDVADATLEAKDREGWSRT